MLWSSTSNFQNNTPKRTSNSSKPLKKRSLKLSESDKGLIPVGDQLPVPDQIPATDKNQSLIALVDKEKGRSNVADKSEIPVVDVSSAPPVIHIQVNEKIIIKNIDSIPMSLIMDSSQR